MHIQVLVNQLVPLRGGRCAVCCCMRRFSPRALVMELQLKNRVGGLAPEEVVR